MVHADSCSGAASFHLHKHIYIYSFQERSDTEQDIYSSKANTVAGNLFILRFLMVPHLHREENAVHGTCSESEHSWEEAGNGATAISTHF